MEDPVANRLSGSAEPNTTAGSAPGWTGDSTAATAPAPDGPPAPVRAGLHGLGPARVLIIRLVLVAAFLGGGLLVRDFMTGNAGEVRAGDCIDFPTGQETIKDVQHHPCDQAHAAEVFAVFDYPAARDAAYPDEAAFDDAAFTRCVAEFAAYTGTAFDDRADLDITYMFPTRDGWTKGADRSMDCLLVRLDGAALTASMRKPGR